MGQIGQIIAASAATAPLYAQRLLAGVTPDKFARIARLGGVELKSNHPAFVFGHLSDPGDAHDRDGPGGGVPRQVWR